MSSARPFARLPRRGLAVGLVGSLLAAATITTASAQEDATTGVGTTVGSTTILDVDLGDLLQLRLIGEDGGTTTDPDAGDPVAFTRVLPLEVGSEVVPALDEVSIPGVESRSSGEEVRKETAIVDLSEVSALVPGLLDGTINPATLVAAVDEAGARGVLSTELADLSVLGGVVSLDSVSGVLGGVTGDAASMSNRLVELDALTVLDLSGVLQLLGLSLSDLPLDTVLGLVDGLGVLDLVADATGLDLGSIGDLEDAVATAQGTIDEAQSLLDGACTGAEDLLGQLGLVDCGDVAGAVDDIQAALDAAADDLLAVIDAVLGVLEGAALLDVDGVAAGVEATARETLDASVAEVTASLGSLRVGGVGVGLVDVDATVDEVLAVAADATGQISDLLGSVHPALADLVEVGLLEQATEVGGQDGATTAAATLTAVRATVTPPDLCDLLTDFDPGDSTGALIDDLGGTVPGAGAVTQVLDDLGSSVDCNSSELVPAGLVDGIAAAVTQPVTVRAGVVESASSFAVVASAPENPEAPPTPTLPRTGGTTSGLWLAAVALLAVVGLGGRRAVRLAVAPSRDR